MMSTPKRTQPDRAKSALGRLALLATALLLGGCSSSPRTAPVDSERARDALKTALDGWKNGEDPATLKARTPSIMVQDMDWMTGSKLVDYQVDGEGRKAESILYVPVKLTLRNPKGQEVKKNVSYLVGTSPSLTIYRDFR